MHFGPTPLFHQHSRQLLDGKRNRPLRALECNGQNDCQYHSEGVFEVCDVIAVYSGVGTIVLVTAQVPAA